MAFNYFLDSDVILDYLLKRTPFNSYAREIFQLAFNQKIEIYTSSLAISNIHYISTKQVGKQQSLKLIKDFLELCKVLSVGEQEIYLAVKSNFSDFEDAIQYFTVISNPDIKGIITRNTSDYKHSTLPVYSSQEFLALFK
ncbi:PIN domain-containing protein [Algoriphagus sp. D3-2-R+10]|uniref:type II toxin-antitoxin system VapC family toxin n=1 Tax=Algoriphagus aurantiacus TaxID=3103948 RepID=UPI002B3AE12D|nr:PIN domain-containing protein [Algoriphagus sp. D3-2-R+10]MEB2775751.1 PIN domain-containing protein [Algoriphagus sp. D3-2-R+10]